ncbi:MAG TPA: transferrin receptor-like dimerization domain-containing protein [Gemmatimonadales bacterium]|jgi:N-acetylated-alpha-linked acidic dipeptidase
MRILHGALLAGLCVAASPALLPAQGQPLRGFPADALADRARLEAVLRTTPDTAQIRQNLLFMSEEPHHAGSPRSHAVAEWALAKFKSWGLDAKIDTSEALMPYPISRKLEMIGPTPFVAQLKEPQIPEDKDSGDQGQLPTFNAYSADGDVTADLVYVNYGIPEDYEQLAKLGVDVRGKIVIARYGRSWRGIKPKVAYEHGAIGCLIYSDPKDDGYFVGDVYPKGPTRPEQGVQRGSVMDMPIYPGDPLTPGWGSKPGGRKLDRAQAVTLLKIPVLPISYGDALPLLKALGGPVAPNDDWKGALPITYHVGGGPAKVHLALSFDWQLRPLYSVVARIPGATYPDQWVLHGNHHDAWVNGAEDPLSGATALLETARSFAALLKTGWRPQRTIILALWDGEEWGLLGSTEFAEGHADELRAKAVSYFNSDVSDKGWIGSSGSHTLESFFREVARDARDPKTGGSALDALQAHNLERARNALDSARAREPFHINALGSGSDYTVYIDHLGIASADLAYGGGVQSGIYHSIYDSYDFYTKFLDPGFTYGVAESGAMGTAVLRMADAPVLPFSFSDAARTYKGYAAELDTLAAHKHLKDSLDLTNVRHAVDALARAGAAFDSALAVTTGRGGAWLTKNRQALGAINQTIYLSERDLADTTGLPRRAWFTHTIYAPGFYTGYGVKTMPGIREALEQGNLAEARAQSGHVAQAVERMAARADKAARDLLALKP